jgi:hypothetical protein
MPGLVPGIHVLARRRKEARGWPGQAGHDEERAYLAACHALVNSPISAFSASRIADGVREKRGAGAGCVTP